MLEFVQDPIISALKKDRLTCRWLQDYKPKKPSLLQKIIKRSPKALFVYPEIVVAIDGCLKSGFKCQFTVVIAELKLTHKTSFTIEAITGFEALDSREVSTKLKEILEQTLEYNFISGVTPKTKDNAPPIRYLLSSGTEYLKDLNSDSTEFFGSPSPEDLEYLDKPFIQYRNSQDSDYLKQISNIIKSDPKDLTPLLTTGYNCLSAISSCIKDKDYSTLFEQAAPKQELLDLTPVYSDLPLLKAAFCIDRNTTETTTITGLVCEGASYKLLKPYQWKESQKRDKLLGATITEAVEALCREYSDALNLKGDKEKEARYKSQEIKIISTDRTLINAEPKVDFIDIEDESFLLSNWVAIAKSLIVEDQLIRTEYFEGNTLTFKQLVTAKEKPAIKVNIKNALFNSTLPESQNPAVLGFLVCLAQIYHQ